jgi:uncharacterized protein YbaP (TraB family)
MQQGGDMKNSGIISRALLLLLASLAIAAEAKTFVWQLEHEGNTLYLAGTIHVLSEADYPLPKAYEQAYSRAENVYFETDMAKAQSVEFQQKLAQQVNYPKGETLLEKLNEPTRNKLEAYMQANSLPLMQFQQMRAGIVAVTISMMEILKLGMSQEGVDYYFFQKTLQEGKTHFGLESMEAQIEFLTRMGEGNESALISQTLAEVKILPEMMQQLLAAWRTGDVEALDKLMIQDMQKNYPLIYQQLLVERNNNWLPAIEKAIADKPVDVVFVGAAHLAGKDSLIALLKAKGYQLKQL